MRFSLTVSRGLREGGAIVLAALALVVAVALLTFDPLDHSLWSWSSVSNAPVHNRVGFIGAACMRCSGGRPICCRSCSG
jgi:hypothetical protein